MVAAGCRRELPEHEVEIAVAVQIGHVAGAQLLFSQHGATAVDVEAAGPTPKDVHAQVRAELSDLAGVTGIERDEIDEAVAVQVGGGRLVSAGKGNIPDIPWRETLGRAPVNLHGNLFPDRSAEAVAKHDAGG